MRISCIRSGFLQDLILLTCPSLSLTTHKVLRWGMVFFITLSAIAVGSSFLPYGSLTVKRILRIGGGVGIGGGSVALGGLIGLAQQQKSFPPFKIGSEVKTSKPWIKVMEPAFQQKETWEGWVQFSLFNQKPIAFAWDTNPPPPSFSLYFFLPVRVTREKEGHYLTFTETKDKKPLLSPGYPIRTLQRKVRQKLLEDSYSDKHANKTFS